MTANWSELARGLTDALHLTAPPIAITFTDAPPSGVAAFDAPMPPATPDGRTGRVPAGCVFWMHAAGRTFSTVPEDHGNCSVGRYTHGMATLDDVAGNADVGALVGAGWVAPEDFPSVPAVSKAPGAVTYGPLAETPVDPDVVLIRLNPKQMMVLHDAWPGLRFEGKPQCHIIAIAKEQDVPAASVGCILSRVRTGLPSTEATCAIPAGRLGEVVDRVVATAAVDAAVAGYAADDAARFA